MKILIHDIETLKCMFLISIYDPVQDKWWDFEISDRKNDMYALAKFLLEDYKDYYFVGFNNLKFDSQVVEYILRHYNYWYELSNKEIVDKIYWKSQDIISDINNDLFPPYREEELKNKQIDLFRIHHMDNKARRCSLKWLEFMMDMPNIEEMPYHHSKETLSDNEMDEIISYCHNDIESTYQFYLYTIGEVEHSFYKGKNKIQDRLDIIEELGFPEKTLNYSDVKIGDEINKRGYMELTGYDQKKLYLLKKNRKPTPKFTFGDCIPKYVKFQTKPFQSLYERVRNERVNLGSGKQEFQFEYKGTKYTIARGGIHSCEANRVINPSSGEISIDADVGSQYPNAIRKRNLYPSHLGKKWLIHFSSTIIERLQFKALGKTDRKKKSRAEGLKLALNGGG